MIARCLWIASKVVHFLVATSSCIHVYSSGLALVGWVWHETTLGMYCLQQVITRYHLWNFAWHAWQYLMANHAIDWRQVDNETQQEYRPIAIEKIIQSFKTHCCAMDFDWTGSFVRSTTEWQTASSNEIFFIIAISEWFRRLVIRKGIILFINFTN